MGIRLKKQKTEDELPASRCSSTLDSVCRRMNVDPDKCVVISFIKPMSDSNIGIIITDPGKNAGVGQDKVAEELARLVFNIGKGNIEKTLVEALLEFAKTDGSNTGGVFGRAFEMLGVLAQKADNTPFMDPSDTFRIHS